MCVCVFVFWGFLDFFAVGVGLNFINFRTNSNLSFSRSKNFLWSCFLVPLLPSRIHGDPHHRSLPLPHTKAHRKSRLYLHIKQSWCTNPGPYLFTSWEEMTIHHPTTNAFAAQKHSQTLTNPIRQLIFGPTWSDMIKWDVCYTQQGGNDKRLQVVFLRLFCMSDVSVALLIITHPSGL